MIRLTMILLAGIGVTLTVAGRDLDRPMSEDAVVVSRADTDILDSGRLALTDEAGAIEKALKATQGLVEPVQRADASATATTARPATAEQLEAEVATRAVVNATRVNLRAGPSVSNQVVDQAVLGQQVEILDRTESGWAEIRVVDTGQTAFIFDRFVDAAS